MGEPEARADDGDGCQEREQVEVADHRVAQVVRQLLVALDHLLLLDLV